MKKIYGVKQSEFRSAPALLFESRKDALSVAKKFEPDRAGCLIDEFLYFEADDEEGSYEQDINQGR